MTVQFIPPGYHTITPYLIVSGLPGTISFLETVFDAKTTVAAHAPSRRYASCTPSSRWATRAS